MFLNGKKDPELAFGIEVATPTRLELVLPP